MNEDWMKHPNLESIDAAKLQMLQSFASQGEGKSQNDLMPLLMMAMQNSQNSGMSFNGSEMEAIIGVMKMGRSKQEVDKIEQMMNIMRMMNK